jgi:hypothetical protein
MSKQNVQEQKTPNQEADDFSAAFNEATQGDSSTAEARETDPNEKAEQAEQAEQAEHEQGESGEQEQAEHEQGESGEQEQAEPAEPAEQGEPTHAAEAPSPAGDAPSEDDDPAVWKQRYKTLQGMFKAEVAREVQQQLQAKNATHEPPPSADSADGGPQTADDAEALLDEVKQDFPNLMKAVDLLVKRAETRIRSEYAPVAETVANSARERHFNAIRSVHEDFDQVKDRLKSWVDQQPAYLRPGYEAVLSHGTTEDVIDLLNRYKQSMGIRKAAPSKPNQDRARQRAAEAAEVVRTRSAPVVPRGEPDKNDYEAAFAEAVSRSQRK